MRNLLIVLGTTSLLGGCANFNSIHHRFNPNNGESMSIDAKQRVVFSVDKDFSGKKWTAFCAEPSPDALAAVSASLGLDASVGAKALGAAFANSESAASIGLRTQSITILRDGMYRLCEGYASGALDDIGFSRLQRRYQAIMLGLLAIEQLTGATVAKQAVLTGNSGAKLGAGLGEITVLVAETRSRAANAKASLGEKTADLQGKQMALEKADADLKKEITASGAESVKAKELKVSQKEASDAVLAADAAKQKAAVTSATEVAELENLESLRKDLQRASAIASTAGSLVDVSSAAPGHTSDASVETVAKAVTKIVTTIVEHDYSREACMDMLTSRNASNIEGLDKVEALKLKINFCLLAMEIGTVKSVAKSTRGTEASAAASATSIANSIASFRAELRTVSDPATLKNAVKDGQAAAEKSAESARQAQKAAIAAGEAADAAEQAAATAATAAKPVKK